MEIQVLSGSWDRGSSLRRHDQAHQPPSCHPPLPLCPPTRRSLWPLCAWLCWVGDRKSYCEKPVRPPLPSGPQEQRGNAVLDPEDQPGGCHLLSALLPRCRQLHEEVLSASAALLHHSPLPGTSSWAHDTTFPSPSFSSAYLVPGPGVRDKPKEQTFFSIPPPTLPLTHRETEVIPRTVVWVC